MIKRILAFLIIISMMIIPVQAQDNTDIILKFNSNAQEDIKNITAYYGSSVETAASYEGRSARIYGSVQGMSTGEISIPENGQNALFIAQSVKVQNSKDAQLRIMSEKRAFITIAFSGNQIKALGKNGYVRLRSYTPGEWIHVQVNVNFSQGTYEVLLDGIKAGGSISCPISASFADAVQYAANGTKDASIYIDDIDISGISMTGTKAAGGGSSESKNAYYETYRARYAYYEPPTENVVSGEIIKGKNTVASSTAEGYDVKNIIDDNPETKWQAAPAVDPVDNGKSLNLNKTAATENTQLAAYSFSPVKGTVVIEQDVMATDVTSEKAIPYVMSSSESTVASIIIAGGNISIAGGAATYRNISSDTWYNIKIVMRTHTQSYDVYINGVLWVEDHPFRGPTEDIAKVQYHMGATHSGNYYVDNIKISYTSPLESFENIVLEEDFEGYGEESEKIGGWSISHSTAGLVSVRSFGKLSEYKFTQYVDLGINRESEFEGAIIEIPEGISIKYSLLTSRKSGQYETVLEMKESFYSGKQVVYFAPQRATNLRLTIFDAVDAMGNTVHAQVGEFRIIRKHRYPASNVAYNANVAVSGEAGATLDKIGINDGIVAEFGRIGDWQSGNETDKWAELTWDEPQSIDRIILHDTASLTDHTKAGVLTFSDGSSIEVKDIKNSGYPKTVDFEPKTVTSVRFTITDFEGSGGLSEFQAYKTGERPTLPEYKEPDEIITLDPLWASRWVCVNDIDNDGELEYISAKCYSDPLSQNHYSSSIAAQEKDGTLIWTWGDPEKGSYDLGSDTPTQIADIDNDGKLEVLTSTFEHLLILDAATGEEKRRFTLPASEKYPTDFACDTIILADISGKGYASDIVVKTRYEQAWAFTSDWKLIWTTCMPYGMKVGHYPRPIDIDNDGKDEVIVGFCCIDDDGSTLWKMDPNEYPGDITLGHKDSLDIITFALTGDTTGDYIINQRDMELLEKHIKGEITLTGTAFTSGDTDGDGKIDEKDKELLAQKLEGKILAFPNKGLPKEEQRFCLTPCGGGSNIIMIDGYGKRIWSLDDATHYETVERVDLGLDDNPYQIIVNDMNITQGNTPIAIISMDGYIISSRFGFIRNRQFNAINWLGEGKHDYIFMPTDNVVLDGNYNLVVKPLCPMRGYDTLGMKSYQTGNTKYTSDMDGDGTTDISLLVHQDDTIKIYNYFNKNGAKVADAPGRGYNISQY